MSRATEAFDRSRTMLALSGPATVDIAFDKGATAAFLAREGIPAARTLDLAAALRAGNGFAFPVVLKPRFGSGSVGVRLVHDLAELRFYADRTPEPVLQEWVPGTEFTLDVLVSPGGSAVCVVPRCRLETRAGEISKGYTVRDRDLEDWGRRVAERLPDAAGPITLQCFKPPDGGVVFMEAGADYPRWLLEWALGLPSTARPDAWRGDVGMLRYDDAVFVRRDELRELSPARRL